ncbi:MAG: hypothetical protein VCF24_09180 [Candidatus Latescibacterota bacterium]
MQNSVVRAFQSGCFKLEWDVLQTESAGPSSIARFKSQYWVRGFLKEVHIPPSAIGVDTCIRNAIDVVSGRSEPLVRHDPPESVLPPDDDEPAEAGPPATEPLSEDAVDALNDGTVRARSRVGNRSRKMRVPGWRSASCSAPPKTSTASWPRAT